MRKLVLGAGLGAVSLLALSPSAAATAGCQFSGTANCTPPLISTAQPFTYSLDGALSNCRSGQAGVPTDGAVSAGQPDVTIQGVTFDEPVPSGDGGCRSAAASGTLWVVWNDRTVTIVDYSTTGITAALLLSGTVAASKTVTGTDGLPHTITTTRYDGQSASAALITHPANPFDCGGVGVASTPIDGLLTLG